MQDFTSFVMTIACEILNILELSETFPPCCEKQENEKQCAKVEVSAAKLQMEQFYLVTVNV
jgi:hypothetical protein